MQRNALHTRVDTLRGPLKTIQVDRNHEGKDIKVSDKTPQNSSKKKFKSPPKLMIDKKGKTTYTLGELLGEV